MNTIITILVTVLIFGILIALHELGHYLAARGFGVGIREYSIGMGPKLWQKKGKYNKFTIRALPIGGYVDMVGESAGDDGSDPEDAGKTPLNTISIWKRMVIVLAGPITNILLGLLVMAIIVLCQDNLASNRIITSSADSTYNDIAFMSGNSMIYVTEDYGQFKKNDIIYTVNGDYVNANEGLDKFLAAHKGEVDVRVLRRNSGELNKETAATLTLSELPLAVNSRGALYFTADFGEFDKYDIISDYYVTGDDGKVTAMPLVVKTVEEALDKCNGEQKFTVTEVADDYSFDAVDISALSLAASGALQNGDEIYSVNGSRTWVAADVEYRIFSDGTKPIDIVVIRDGKKITVENVVFFMQSEQGIVHGVGDFIYERDEKTFGTVAKNAVFQPISMLRMTIDSLLDTFKGKYGMEALSGPVGIGEQIGQVISTDNGGFGETLKYLFNMFSMISLSLGVCNLLPLPVLDGGRVVLYTIEAIRRKPLKPSVESAIMAISTILVFGLMIFIMVKDTIGLF